jgi:UDP-N-acetylglucosamine acyltransferase
MRHWPVTEHSFISFASYASQSIPPYVTVSGEKAKARGINSEGLKRRGFTSDQIRQVRRAYRLLYRSGLPLEEALQSLTEMARDAPELDVLVDFIKSSDRSIIR